jgi:hypothetical protein
MHFFTNLSGKCYPLERLWALLGTIQRPSDYE